MRARKTRVGGGRRPDVVIGVSSKPRVDVLGALLAVALLWGASPPDSPVADATMRGDAGAVRSLLREGADVNAAQSDGMTALHWAAERGSWELADVLIGAGANVAAVTRLGAYTPLHLAARGAHHEVVERLLDARADPTAATSSGAATPLHLAARSGSAASVRAIAQRGGNLDARDAARGQTPLMFAAAAGRVEAIRVLVELGAEVGLTSATVDIPARAAEDRAAKQVRDEVLASFRTGQPTGSSWQPTPAQVQAAVRAANDFRERAKGETLDAGEAADPDADENPAIAAATQDPYDPGYASLVYAQGGLSALHLAARDGRGGAALALVDGGADIDQLTDSDGTTPILIATINGHFDLALALLARGADPNLASHAGTTPLYAAINTVWAPKSRYPQQQAYQQQQATLYDVMRALLDAGADPDARLDKHLWFMEYTFTQLDVDTRGATPFWRAAYALDLPAMEILVEHGADPAIPTMKPPARRSGADEGDPDPSGLPPVAPGGPDVHPIHAATGHAYGTGFAGVHHRHAPDAWLPVVRYLVEEHGADVNARDANGFAPLHWAASRGDNEMIRYLVGKGADVTVLSRRGHTTADMANGPVQRISPFPETIALLEGLGSQNSHNCVSC